MARLPIPMPVKEYVLRNYHRCWFCTCAVLNTTLSSITCQRCANRTMQIYARYEFPYELDLSPYMASTEHLARFQRTAAPPSASSTSTTPTEWADDGPQLYQLYGVLVHTGTYLGGHYYSFLRPQNSAQWVKFNDGCVMRATPVEAMQDNFGGSGFQTRTAYMLVYLRRSLVTRLLLPMGEANIPLALRSAIESERTRKEQERSLLDIRIWTDIEIRQWSEQHPLDLFDFASAPDMGHAIAAEKQWTLGDLRQAISERLALPVPLHCVCVWTVDTTARALGEQLVGDHRKLVEMPELAVHANSRAPRRLLYVHPAQDRVVDERTLPSGQPANSGSKSQRSHSLVFLKAYSAVRQQTFYLGSHAVALSAPAAAISHVATELLRARDIFAAPTECYLQRSRSQLLRVELSESFARNRVATGDTLWVELRSSAEPDSAREGSSARLSLPAYFDDIQLRVAIFLVALDQAEAFWLSKDRSLENPDGHWFYVELLLTDNYTRIQEVIHGLTVRACNNAPHPATHLRLWEHVAGTDTSRHSKPVTVFRPSGRTNALSDMRGTHRPLVLYFEWLQMPVTQFEQLIEISVEYWDCACQPLARLAVRLARQATVADAMRAANAAAPAALRDISDPLLSTGSPGPALGKRVHLCSPNEPVSRVAVVRIIRPPALRNEQRQNCVLVQVCLFHFEDGRWQTRLPVMHSAVELAFVGPKDTVLELVSSLTKLAPEKPADSKVYLLLDGEAERLKHRDVVARKCQTKAQPGGPTQKATPKSTNGTAFPDMPISLPCFGILSSAAPSTVRRTPVRRYVEPELSIQY
eukprot:TRINITY_DN11804_c0_g1_i2.p1 TRINITY_DN11804_c0_g1~~TRINITY_DN11804_c0_g1_i2.p1  ORF type:complete len:811 (-),score=77.72 TRINITY_DN11804_c0_g1_i2:48-2480(-)